MVKTPEQLAKIAAQARKSFAASQQTVVKNVVPVNTVFERYIPTCAGNTRILAYRSCLSDKPIPVFVNMHGGGFIMGSADDDDTWCRQIANSVPCLVVNIEYHLAPEHKFPTALEECYDVLQWLHLNAQELDIDPERIAVGGQSAGGNLAAGLCLLARDRGLSIAYQVLNYPPLDLTIDPHSKTTHDTILTARMQILFNACYFRTESDALNPLISPLLASDLSNLPGALIITAEYDPLRPEAEAYAARLTAASVHVSLESFPGCMHAFTHFGPPLASETARQIVQNKLTSALRLETRE